jgi:hypothetical protein
MGLSLIELTILPIIIPSPCDEFWENETPERKIIKKKESRINFMLEK